MEKAPLFIVFYVKELTMRERIFNNKDEADMFAQSVNSEAVQL